MPNSNLSKRKPSIRLIDLPQVVEAEIGGSVRALLISRSGDGFMIQPVHQGESVLNIRMDLVAHLNECAYPDDWLNNLKESIDQRMARRRIARQAGALSVLGENGWGPLDTK